MHILAITNIYPTPQAPGTGTFVEQQLKGLSQLGLEIDLLHVDRICKGRGGYRGLQGLVQQHVLQLQPDIVHVMYGGVLADIVTRTVNDRPTVVSFCGADLVGERLSRPLGRLSAAVGVWCSRRAAKRAAGIIVKSRNLRDALPARLGTSEVAIIPNGVNLHRFKPSDRCSCRDQLGWDCSRFHVLFNPSAGDPTKRLYLAQAAVDHLTQSGTNAELHLLDGVMHEAVPIWLNASDAVILTSQSEGSPNIIKEALACDVPVVSVDVGDVRERLEGIEGCYLGSADAEDLSAKLRLVHMGSGRVAGRIAMQELSLERVAIRVRQFYEESWNRLAIPCRAQAGTRLVITFALEFPSKARSCPAGCA